jgi:alpha-methylacyl-CoA racemase
MLAMGVLLAVIEGHTSGKGQVIDVAMTDGAAYVALPLYKWLQPGGLLPTDDDGRLDPTQSVLHSAAPWGDVYTCKCGGWFSVQALEPQFYVALLRCLGLPEDGEGLPARSDVDEWPVLASRFREIFLTKTRDEWEAIFRGACCCSNQPQPCCLHGTLVFVCLFWS